MRLPFITDSTIVGAAVVVIIVAFVAVLNAAIMQEVIKDLLHHRCY